MNPIAMVRSIVACLAVLCFCQRPGFAGEFAYLENSDSGDVTVIAIPGHTVVSTIKIGPFLDDVTASHDGRILYVNRYDSLAAGDRHMAESGEVIAVSTETEKLLWRAGRRLAQSSEHLARRPAAVCAPVQHPVDGGD